MVLTSIVIEKISLNVCGFIIVNCKEKVKILEDSNKKREKLQKEEPKLLPGHGIAPRKFHSEAQIKERWFAEDEQLAMHISHHSPHH